MYDMAAQIPLETRNNVFAMVPSGDIKNVSYFRSFYVRRIGRRNLGT